MKRRRYMVGIRKEYFPPSIHPPVKEISAYYEVVRGVLAMDRIEAANQVWAQNGERWLSLMNPDTTLNGNRIISLEVNDPVRKIGPGRLQGVKVFEGTGRIKSDEVKEAINAILGPNHPEPTSMPTILPGSSYRYDLNPSLYSSDNIQGAIVTVRSVSPDEEGLNVAYDFRTRQGITGSGTMRLDWATKVLKPFDPCQKCIDDDRLCPKCCRCKLCCDDTGCKYFRAFWYEGVYEGIDDNPAWGDSVTSR